MNEPKIQLGAKEYRLAGFMPTLGGANRARMLSRGHARLAEIKAIQEKHCKKAEEAAKCSKHTQLPSPTLAQVTSTTSSYSGERFPVVDAAIARGLGRNMQSAAPIRIAMDPIVFAGVKASMSADRVPFVLPYIPNSLKMRRKKGSPYVDDAYTVALAEALVDSYKAGLGDPSDLWRFPPPDADSDSEVSESDSEVTKFDFIPRRKMSTRIANALVIAASSLGKLEMEVEAEETRLRKERYAPSPHAWLIMQPVHAAIINVGAEKRASECREVGPAAVGHSYVQIDEQVYLRRDWDGSNWYVGDADRVRRPTRMFVNDAEAVERAWAESNTLRYTGFEMVAGFARMDLTDSWNEQIDKANRKAAIVSEYKLQVQYLHHRHLRSAGGVSASRRKAEKLRKLKRQYQAKLWRIDNEEIDDRNGKDGN